MNQNSTYITEFADLANSEKQLNAELFSDVGIKHWSMDEGKQITYQKDDSHTLSIYLKGGEKNFRTDFSSAKGAPGKICLMPQGQNSQWQIKGKVEFVHLYFTDEILQRYAVSCFGIDARSVDLADLLFQDDIELKNLFSENFQYCRNIDSYSPLFAEQSIHNVLHHLLTHYNTFKLKERTSIGGLSPYHFQFVREIIYEGLSEKLTIEELAGHTGLSVFHFARMFKLSFGMSPASYITRVRVDKIKSLLKTDIALSEVSLQTGFNQQSHMSQHFKRVTGMTPGAYRKRIQ